MIGKCSNCDNFGSPFGKVHEEFEDRPSNELLCVFCGDEAIEKAPKDAEVKSKSQIRRIEKELK